MPLLGRSQLLLPWGATAQGRPLPVRGVTASFWLLLVGAVLVTSSPPSPSSPNDGYLQTAPHDEVMAALATSNFDCQAQEYPGYYVDTSTTCRGFHVCQADGRHDVFVCPNNTAFQQRHLVCDWADNVNCQEATSFYGVNAQLFQGARLQEPPHIRDLLQTHMQPHLHQFKDLLQAPPRGSTQDTRGPPSSAVSEPLFESLKEQLSHRGTSMAFITTESVMDFLGESLSGMAGEGFPHASSSLLMTPRSHHPSW